MKHLISDKVAQARVANWLATAAPVEKNPTWIEKRQAIVFGDHTYLLEKGQIFQCGHCGHYDPKWVVTEVLAYFEQTFGIKPIEIDVTCSVAVTQ